LQTNDLIALSLLINEEIYLIDDDQYKVNDDLIIKPLQIIEIVEQEIAIVSEETEKYKTKTEETTVPIIPKEEPNATPSKPEYKYLGDNNKYILIIVNEPNSDFLNKKDLAFLTKILGAKKLDINDVAIVNLAKYQSLDFDQLKSFFGFSKLITFGINPKILNVEGAVSNKNSIYKDVAVLGTWHLSVIDGDVNKKTTFWNELKIF
jgi:hypothetical protein